MGTYVDVGRDALAALAVGDSGSVFDQMGVGTDSTAESSGDESLGNEVYRTSKSNEPVSIETTSTVGEIDATITVTGGTEVPSDTSIEELGIFFADGTLLYRKVFGTPTTVGAGESATFTVDIDLLNA